MRLGILVGCIKCGKISNIRKVYQKFKILRGKIKITNSNSVIYK